MDKVAQIFNKIMELTNQGKIQWSKVNVYRGVINSNIEVCFHKSSGLLVGYEIKESMVVSDIFRVIIDTNSARTLEQAITGKPIPRESGILYLQDDDTLQEFLSI